MQPLEERLNTEHATVQPGAKTLDSKFVGGWVVATFAGWTLGFFLILGIISVAALVGLGDAQFPVGLGMGAGVGFLQGRRIRPWIASKHGWWIASSAGMAAPFLVFDAMNAFAVGPRFSLATSVVLGGIATGILQWRLLRRHAGRAAWWIGAAAVGWALGGSTLVVNGRLLPKIPGMAGALLYVAVVLMGGILLGLVGGAALRRIGWSESAR